VADHNSWIYILPDHTEEGHQSFHLMANGGSYWDTSKLPSDQMGGIPAKMMLTTESFDREKKEFRGIIDLEVVAPDGKCGSLDCVYQKVDIVLIKFSDDMQKMMYYEEVITMSTGEKVHKIEKDTVAKLLRSEKV